METRVVTRTIQPPGEAVGIAGLGATLVNNSSNSIYVEGLLVTAGASANIPAGQDYVNIDCSVASQVTITYNLLTPEETAQQVAVVGTVGVTGTVSLGLPQPFAKAFDYDGSGNLIYSGKAAPGSAKSAAVWQVTKYVYSGSNLTDTLYANGGTANQIWDDRASLSYS